MNILVTGSNGFIGHHVASYLKGQGHYVVGLGRSSAPYDPSSVSEYVSCDLGKGGEDLPARITVKLDAVIHLAADMRKEPHLVEVITANCAGTQRLLEMCDHHGIKVFLQLSSLPVIGKPLLHPITEEHPIHPYTVYHITKRTEELLANYAYEYHGVRTASFRISAPIGTRMNEKTIFPTFIRKALANEDITVLGKGTRRQNYVYVRDIAKCLELSLTSAQVHGVYNLTSNLLLSNYELAELCVRTLHSDSKVILQGTDASDDYVWDATLGRIREDASYNPQTRIEDVIIEYAQWLQKQTSKE